MLKPCAICEKIFEARGTAKYCPGECRVIANRKYLRKYRQTAKGREKNRNRYHGYRQSEEWREKQRKYAREYRQTAKGREGNRKHVRKHNLKRAIEKQQSTIIHVQEKQREYVRRHAGSE